MPQCQVEEDAAQKKMKQEVIAKEQALADIKKDYQVLRFKFQRYLAANEQTGLFRNFENCEEQQKVEFNYILLAWSDLSLKLS